MIKRISSIALVLALALVTLAPVAAVASGPKTAANSFAVCGCGMVFVPGENTKYVTHEGHEYACCSDGCQKMASMDPAKAAAMADAAMVQTMNKAQSKIEVANLVSVTSAGTQAVCCGKAFTVGAETKYMEHDGKKYACCGQGCFDAASKDPAKAALSFQKQVEGTK